MIKNYLTTAYRHLLRHRTTTLMNVISLSVGMSCCLVVYVIIKHEYTYGDFQPQADRLCRVVAQSPVLGTTITKRRLVQRGYQSLFDYYAKVSLKFNEPPYTRSRHDGPYVRWCERRTGGHSAVSRLLD